MSLMDRLPGKTSEQKTAEVVQMPVRASAARYSADRGIVASAEKIDVRKKAGVNSLLDRPYAEWQRDAWMYYDAIAEVKYAFGLLGSVMSRIRIFAALVLDPDTPPQSVNLVKRRAVKMTDEERAKAQQQELTPPPGITPEIMDYAEKLVKDLGSGNGGIPGMQRTFAINTAVAGECYLTQINGKWSIRSTEEITIRRADNKPMLKEMRTSENRIAQGGVYEKELPANTWIGRIWRNHPRFSKEPDSSMLGLLEMCDELLTLQRMIRAVARSKMNAGMVFIPDGISAAAQSVTETPEEGELEADPFEQEFMQALISPVGDESSAATVVPLLARGDGDLGNQIKYVKFDREADQQLVQRADRTLERIMQGIDVPKDVVTGLANVKYSNAVQIDEGLYKSHVEPLELLFVDSLTAIYLKPALKKRFPQLDDDTLSQLVIWYDPTEVVTKPDPAHAAETLYDNYEISGAAFRRAFGFSDTDAPDQNEIANRFVLEKGMLPPELVTALVKHMLPTIFAQAQQDAAQQSGMPQSAQDMLYGDQSQQGAQQNPDDYQDQYPSDQSDQTGDMSDQPPGTDAPPSDYGEQP